MKQMSVLPANGYETSCATQLLYPCTHSTGQLAESLVHKIAFAVVRSTASLVTACVRDSSNGCVSCSATMLTTAYEEVHMQHVLADHLHPAHTMFQLS